MDLEGFKNLTVQVGVCAVGRTEVAESNRTCRVESKPSRITMCWISINYRNMKYVMIDGYGTSTIQYRYDSTRYGTVIRLDPLPYSRFR